MPPLPSHLTERRKAVPVDRLLPAEGRKGRRPSWPSGHEPTEAEARLWARLWKLPQAVAWADLPGVAELVERYTRVAVRVAADLDAGTVMAATLAQLRGMETDLGLNPPGLAKLRWQIAPATPPKPAPTVAPMRPRRMRAPVTEAP